MKNSKIEPALITQIQGDPYWDDKTSTHKRKPLTREQLEDLDNLAQNYPYGMLAINGNMGFDIYWLQDHQLCDHPTHPIPREGQIEKTFSVALYDFGTEERAERWIKAETMKHAGKKPL